MGHHLSKPTVAVSKSTTEKRDIVASSSFKTQISQTSYSSATTAAIGVPRALSSATSSAASARFVGRNSINLHIEENPGNNISNLNQISPSSSHSGSLDSFNNCAARQIIIKIQLAKMENGNGGEMPTESMESLEQSLTVAAAADLNANTVQSLFQNQNPHHSQQYQQYQQHQQQQKILNLTLNTNTSKDSAVHKITGNDISSMETAAATTTSPKISVNPPTTTLFINNNNLNGIASNVANLATSSMADLHLNNDDDVIVINEIGKIDDDGNNDEVWKQRVESDDANDSLAATAVEYCEVLQQSSVDEMLLNRTQESSASSSSSSSFLLSTAAPATMLAEEASMSSSSNSNSCCHNKSKPSSTSSTSNNKQRRCCKCKCRDAIRGIRGMLETSSTSKAVKQQKDIKENKMLHSRMLVSEHRHSSPLVLPSTMSNSHNIRGYQQQFKRNSIAQMPHGHSSLIAPVVAGPSSAATTTSVGLSSNVATNQVSIWAPASSSVGDVIIHISTPKFVVEQCAPVVTVGRINDAQHSSTAIRLMATEFIPAVNSSGNMEENGKSNANIVARDAAHHADITVAATNASAGNQINQSSNATMRCNQTHTPIVHSQIDFVHYLVPDLERIMNSSFYWGKMDRYEAERLLEGMPEGTFLLRDSAQEEFLFSVTFRKYERSLHARIEQSGHKFSFDCHDPCVFTAPTVTGLLEHYKDPSCVMFFEPMLTIPLHRKNPFSLQQLCRATVVSHTTYDGISQLELPTRLRAYMKEYHYKQKLRVKPFDEPFYSCT